MNRAEEELDVREQVRVFRGQIDGWASAFVSRRLSSSGEAHKGMTARTDLLHWSASHFSSGLQPLVSAGVAGPAILPRCRKEA